MLHNPGDESVKDAKDALDREIRFLSGGERWRTRRASGWDMNSHGSRGWFIIDEIGEVVCLEDKVHFLRDNWLMESHPFTVLSHALVSCSREFVEDL